MATPTKEQIKTALRLIYDSWIVRYGTPPETMAGGMRTDMNTYLDSINSGLVMGPCIQLTDVLTQLQFVGITGIDRDPVGGDGAH